MNEFHPTERVNPVPMVGDIDGGVQRRSAIKLASTPKVMVCIPIGAKGLTTVLTCPQCTERGEAETEFEVDHGFQPQGLVHINFMLQHMNWVMPLNVTVGYVFKTNMLSAAARNVMTLETLKHKGVDYIFYVDDDMMFPPLAFYTLYNAMEQNPTWGAVTGVYTTRKNPPEPLIYTEHGRGADWTFELGPNAEPTQIIGCGAGCLMARTSAIREWMDLNPGTPIWADSAEILEDGNRVTWGHDVRFIRNLTECGWPCYVDGRVICEHYDRLEHKNFTVPDSAPGWAKHRKNINTQEYWDNVYADEGFSTVRLEVPLANAVVSKLQELDIDNVVELGCGSGLLGQRITARFPCRWTGFDVSGVAVAQAKARSLDARRRDLKELSSMELHDLMNGVTDALVATELMEHLDEDDSNRMLDVANACFAEYILFTTPWKCMGPDTVREHSVLVDEKWLENATTRLTKYELISTGMVDDHRAMHVWKYRGE